MIDEKPAKPADGDISPYLQQPLRTLATAQRDQKRQQREAAERPSTDEKAGLTFRNGV